MGDQIDASVVIAAHTFDRYEQVLRCVETVRSGRRAPQHVVVVVDNNVELMTALAASLAGRAKVVANSGIGLSAARNTGTKLIDSDVAAFVDDDAWADPGWLEAILAAFESDRSVVGVGGRVVPDFASPRAALPPELLWVVGCTYDGHPDGSEPITRPIGANMAFRREALDAVGGFLTEFGVGSGKKPNSNDELAVSALIRDKFGEGCIRYAPDAVVHHCVPADRVTWRYLVRRSAAEGRSKAAIRRTTKAAEMNHDQRYVRETLIPAVLRRTRKAITRLDRHELGAATKDVVAAAVTALVYLRELCSRAVSSRTQSGRRSP